MGTLCFMLKTTECYSNFPPLFFKGRFICCCKMEAQWQSHLSCVPIGLVYYLPWRTRWLLGCRQGSTNWSDQLKMIVDISIKRNSCNSMWFLCSWLVSDKGAKQNIDNNPQPFDALELDRLIYANGVNCVSRYVFVQIDYILKGSCYLAPTQI